MWTDAAITLAVVGWCCTVVHTASKVQIAFICGPACYLRFRLYYGTYFPVLTKTISVLSAANALHQDWSFHL